MTSVCAPPGLVTWRSRETIGTPVPAILPAPPAVSVATAIERLVPDPLPGPLLSLQAPRNVLAPSAQAGRSTRAIERGEDMDTVRERVCAIELRNADSRILNRSALAHYPFVPKNVLHAATSIYRGAERHHPCELAERRKVLDRAKRIFTSSR